MTRNAEPRPRLFRSGLYLGLALSSVAAAYGVTAYWVLRPLHAEGWWQPLLGHLLAVDRVLDGPGLIVLRGILHRGHRMTPHVWAFVLAVNVIVYFLIGLCAGVLWRWLRQPRTLPLPTGSASPDPAVCSRRRFLRRSVGALGGCAVAGLGYGVLVEPRRFGVTRQVVPVRGLPAALDGLRVVHLTDIHHGPWLSLDYVREVVQAANDLAPDLICLTGDYVQTSSAYTAPVLGELARLRARAGVVGVLGNHDWWEGPEQMRREFARAGIPLLDNGRLVLTPEFRLAGAAEAGLALCGVGDLWEDEQDYARALGGLPGAMPRLLLSHNPDVAEEPELVAGGLRVDLMLSGHTHGGQVWLPGLGTPVTNSHYGQKYARGLVQGPVCAVYVGRGIGVSGLPLRLGVPPEIAVLELRAQPS